MGCCVPQHLHMHRKHCFIFSMPYAYMSSGQETPEKYMSRLSNNCWGLGICTKSCQLQENADQKVLNGPAVNQQMSVEWDGGAQLIDSRGCGE
jgi:hypothetical protein